jgi:DNA mismatch endonuclease (patch repair protein)
MDKLTVAERSENMRRIRSKDTSPELAIRRIVHRLGYRYRIHNGELPGRPDGLFVAAKNYIHPRLLLAPARQVH